MFKRLLFPSRPDGTAASAILLIVRIVFGLLLMNHGIEKWSNYQELSAVFPDPLGIGSPLSLGLAIFGELACSMAFIIGFLYRLAMIPMIFTMMVAFFVIHGKDPFADVYHWPGKICRRSLDRKSLFTKGWQITYLVLRIIVFKAKIIFFLKKAYICRYLKWPIRLNLLNTVK